MNTETKQKNTYDFLIKELTALEKRYPFINLTVLGRSFRGRNIYMVSLGRGKDRMLYVATHHGAEGITSGVLLRYLKDICGIIEAKGKISGVDVDFLLSKKQIDIIPMLNPDGVELSANGCPETDPMYKRLVKINGGDDFTLWQANGRGVDLNHNYDSGFAEYKELEKQMNIIGGSSTRYSGEYPESEPETACLCRYLRTTPPKNVITLHSQGEEIYYSSGNIFLTASYKNALVAARLTGYKISRPQGTAAYGGLLDYLTQKLCIPCITIECGKGKNPLPPSDEAMIYGTLKELLLSAPVKFSTDATKKPID